MSRVWAGCLVFLLAAFRMGAADERIVWGQSVTQVEGQFGFAEAGPDGVDVNAVGAPPDGETAAIQRDFTVASTLPAGTPVQLDVVIELYCDPGTANAGVQVLSGATVLLDRSVSGGQAFVGTNRVYLEVGGTYRLVASADMATPAYGEADAIVTFLPPRPVELDLVAATPAWNTAQGGVDFSVEVRGGVLPKPASARLHWSAGTSLSDILPGAAVHTHPLPAGSSGVTGSLHVPGTALRDAPAAATHLLLVVDPDGVIAESARTNNVAALRRDIFVVPVGVNYREGPASVLDLNGWESADQVRAAFLRLGERFVVADTLALSSRDAASNWEKIKSWINFTRSGMKPGDGFVFYIHTHGDYSDSVDPVPFGNERLVRSQNNPYLYFLDSARKESTGNEQLRLRTNEFVDDDEFADFFRGDTWKDVRKLFLIDACFSGGFWDGGDNRDLVTLPKAGLIASAPETDFSYSTKLKGDSFFSRALAEAADELATLPAFSFTDLARAIELKGRTFAGDLSIVSGLEAFWSQEVTAQWRPQVSVGVDFDLRFGTSVPALPVLAFEIRSEQVDVIFGTIAGWGYQVEVADSLSGGFRVLGGRLVGTGEELRREIPRTAGDGAFYRVTVYPVP